MINHSNIYWKFRQSIHSTLQMFIEFMGERKPFRQSFEHRILHPIQKTQIQHLYNTNLITLLKGIQVLALLRSGFKKFIRTFKFFRMKVSRRTFRELQRLEDSNSRLFVLFNSFPVPTTDFPLNFDLYDIGHFRQFLMKFRSFLTFI